MQVSVESTKMDSSRSVLTRIKLIGIVCLVLAYWRATLYTVSGIYSRTKFKNTSSRCNGGRGGHKKESIRLRYQSFLFFFLSVNDPCVDAYVSLGFGGS